MCTSLGFQVGVAYHTVRQSATWWISIMTLKIIFQFYQKKYSVEPKIFVKIYEKATSNSTFPECKFQFFSSKRENSATLKDMKCSISLDVFRGYPWYVHGVGTITFRAITWFADF